jgi:DNA polymerase I
VERSDAVTSRSTLDGFREVWLVDLESLALPGERADPVCLVGLEFKSGRSIRLARDDLQACPEPPYPTDNGTLIVAFDSTRVLAGNLAQHRPIPSRVLDLKVEFRNKINGRVTPHGAGLFGALAWHGLNPLPGIERPRLRALVERGGPWTGSEQRVLLDAPETRVSASVDLLKIMLPDIDLERGLLRGRYGAVVARMERSGVPIDVPVLQRLREGWRGLQDGLIREVDSGFGVYEGRTFRRERWEAYLDREGISWPRSASGALALDDDTFREMARSNPGVALMRELRNSLAQLRLDALTVGSDGRNRVALAPFASKTGRNQPSSNSFIFGPSCWLRGLIRPEPGRALAYVDWTQQEYGIAAALSRDPAMIDAYRSGDPYLAFGKQAGRIPPWGTKRTHKAEREAFKAYVLGVLYGMGPRGLAERIGQPVARGRELLQLHRAAYPGFWASSDEFESHAMLTGLVRTVFGWTLHLGGDANPRSVRNFPCRANGAEMLRLACCLATERGVEVVAPVHDAMLVEGPTSSIEEVVSATQSAMAEASEIVLDGFRLRTEVKVVRWPDRYMDDRGREFWGRVMGLLAKADESSSLCSHSA